ncbi:TRAP transporter substrate-binding protein DctP [Aminivibrio sp.]|uniref:TRAP transporter substrate-binding protein n=1 Tax=Aminivibrio sp. TaxID=1872489 RepID=UPI001A54F8E3|nr:TRAP transporter substrate-binding protein DctP [Aminivibrio sp.]MBL3538659.1 TRAP transporter substrate-binding protein DctP [Aminivibrio sp.]MDK2959189.1 TRAP-type transport system periplasmic protein [Synergistaceae bacterium]
MKRFLKAAAAVLVCFFVFGSVSPAVAAKQEWKFAIEEITGSVQDEFAQFFKKKIMERIPDTDIEIYPVGVLGDSEDLTEQTMNGVLHFTMASPGHLGTFIPVVRVFSLPFIWSDRMEVNKEVMKNSVAIYSLLDKEYEKNNLKLLGVFPEGWQVWTANKPLRTPDDFKNFRMRIMGDPLLAEIYKSYGANAVQVPYPDLYSALQLKMVDGNIQPYFAHEEMKFYEQQDYFIDIREMPFVATFVVSLKWFETLPAEQKKIIEETARETIDFIFDMQEKMNDERLQKMLKIKPSLQVIVPTPEEREAFKKLSLPVRDTYVKMAEPYGKDVLETLLKELEEAEKKIAK